MWPAISLGISLRLALVLRLLAFQRPPVYLCATRLRCDLRQLRNRSDPYIKMVESRGRQGEPRDPRELRHSRRFKECRRASCQVSVDISIASLIITVHMRNLTVNNPSFALPTTNPSNVWSIRRGVKSRISEKQYIGTYRDI